MATRAPGIRICRLQTNFSQHINLKLQNPEVVIHSVCTKTCSVAALPWPRVLDRVSRHGMGRGLSPYCACYTNLKTCVQISSTQINSQAMQRCGKSSAEEGRRLTHTKESRVIEMIVRDGGKDVGEGAHCPVRDSGSTTKARVRHEGTGTRRSRTNVSLTPAFTGNFPFRAQTQFLKLPQFQRKRTSHRASAYILEILNHLDYSSTHTATF